MTGRLKTRGNMMLATKLDTVLKVHLILISPHHHSNLMSFQGAKAKL